MSLELIIQEIKAIGNILPRGFSVGESGQGLEQEQRKYRVKIGNEQSSSRRLGEFISENQLIFDEAFSYKYQGDSHLLFIEIFKPHKYLDNSDLDSVLTAEVDLSDLTNLNGDYIETSLLNSSGQSIGKLILSIETFKKGPKFYEKVSSKVFFEAVKQQKEKQIHATQAAKNIKHLIVNNSLPDNLMTISAMTLICEKEDNDIFMRDGFIMVRYGSNVKAYSSMIKITSKQSVNWTDYIEFMKNDGIKFQFFFFHYDEIGNLGCKAKGEIKYVVFDQTINLHSIQLFDKRSSKYATLMVKFGEKIVDKVIINNKIDKKIKQLESVVQKLIEEFNQFKFQNKNNNHILSEKLRQLELLEQTKQQQKQKPINPQQKKKNQEHSKFIDFLQKQMIRIERQLTKRDQNHKKQQRKHVFLPNINEKRPSQSRVGSKEKTERSMNGSFSAGQFKGLKLPKI